MDQLLNHFDQLRDKAQDLFASYTSCLCQSDSKLKLNGRSFKIIRILGEGGFSFVYLAEDEQSGRQFAMKKIRCPTGQEGVKEAMREVEAYRRFRHPNIIRIMDSAVVDDSDGEGKIVYLFLPYYRRGNLQDAINDNNISKSRFSEAEILQYFLGTCQAVSALHDFRGVAPSANAPKKSRGAPQSYGRADDGDDAEDSLLPEPEGDGEGGFSYGAPARPRKPKSQRTMERVYEGDDHLDTTQQAAADAPPGTTELIPYAHRDIKPANVMISDEGQPILMDFGSTIKARIPIENRTQALIQQDLAAEQSSMPYRAPELFDVKTGIDLTEKTDIWSLGCLLFAFAYGHSPFETTQTTEQGGSMAMAVMNAQYKHPQGTPYSDTLKALIDSMLKTDPDQRPDIHQVIEATQRALSGSN